MSGSFTFVRAALLGALLCIGMISALNEQLEQPAGSQLQLQLQSDSTSQVAQLDGVVHLESFGPAASERSNPANTDDAEKRSTPTPEPEPFGDLESTGVERDTSDFDDFEDAFFHPRLCLERAAWPVAAKRGATEHASVLPRLEDRRFEKPPRG